VILVGATDGIGLALAHEFLERSWRVGLLGRGAGRVRDAAEALARAHPERAPVARVLDVTDRAAVAPALDAVRAELGGMDVLVYCAGVIDQGADPGPMFAVNAVGAIDVLEWGAARLVDAGGGGRLAAIGSVAGDRGRGGNPIYGASKAALHQYTEGLRRRLHGSGVGVTTVKPGWVRTKMLGSPPSFPPSISAAEAARAIVRGLERGRDVFYVPAWWGAVSLALRLLPRPVFKRLAPP
jgi:NAD(P)-dependent dehydrogenase (short-subunit alcohol dehydrogenase family)